MRIQRGALSQKEGHALYQQESRHLRALPGSERPRLLRRGNNSSEVTNFAQTAHRARCNMRDGNEERTYSVVRRSGEWSSYAKNDGAKNPGESS